MKLRYLLEWRFQFKKKMNTSEEKLKNTKSLQIPFVIVSPKSQDINPQAPVAQKIADEVFFRRFQGEGVEFF